MTGTLTEQGVAFALALLLSAILASVVKPLAIRANLVSRPRADRWSRTIIPLGGGAAITGALVLGLVVIGLKTPPDPAATGSVLGDRRFDLAIACVAIFVLGLVDDKVTLSPPAKLVVQTAAACFLVLRGTTLPLGPELVRAPITVAWFVFLTNSVNLLDNMDGSAAGVSVVASGFVYVIAAGGNDPALAASAAVLTGAALGFLLHNFPPASMFMGDAGSLVLGFALAGLSARLPGHDSSPHLGSVAAPALILALPIFDTGLVWIARRSAKRPFFLGGRDHTTHRLVALGLSERQTVLVLYGAAFVLGLAAIAVARGGLATAVLVALGAGIGLLLCGVFLSDVRVYKAASGTSSGTRIGAGTGESAREALNPVLYAAELTIDIALMSGAWVAAYVVKFADSGSLEDYLRGSCLRALPFVIGLKLLALLSQGLYRGVWRSIQFEDLFKIVKACALGTVLVVAAAAVADRLVDYSREVFALDLVFATGGVFLSRAALRALRRSVALIAYEPRRALLVGARSLGPLVEQALSAEGKPLFKLVGVLDPETPAGVRDATPPVPAGTLADAATVAESVQATVALVALAESHAGRTELVHGLQVRGVEVVSVRAKLE